MKKIFLIVIVLFSLNYFLSNLYGAQKDKIIFSNNMNEFFVLNCDTKICKKYLFDEWIMHPSFLPYKNEFVCVTTSTKTWKNKLSVFNFANKKIKKTYFPYPLNTTFVLRPKYSPNGNFLAINLSAVPRWKIKNTLIIYNMKLKKINKVITEFQINPYSPISWSSNNDKIIFCNEKKRMIVFNLKTNSFTMLSQGTSPCFYTKNDQTIIYINKSSNLAKMDLKNQSTMVISPFSPAKIIIGISNKNSAVFYTKDTFFNDSVTIHKLNLNTGINIEIYKHLGAFSGDLIVQ